MRQKSTGKPQSVYKKFFRRVISALFFALILIWIFLPKPELMENISSSQAIYSEDLTLLRLTLSKDDKYRLFLSHHQIPQELIDAFLLKEDKYFYWHKGFNPVSLLRATWETFISKNTMGASTLTMQLARIRYGLNTKTIGGKLYQIFKAIQIERHYSKKEILEAYLNLTPMGRNIEGVGAASLIYFGKNVDQLNLPEILTLAVIPQSPSKRIVPSPLIPLPQGEREISGGEIKGEGENPLQKARSNLFQIWIKKHPKDKNKTPLFSLPLFLKKPENLPFLAPHFVNGVIAENSNPIIITTLNLSFQQKIETLIKNFIRIKKAYGIKNAAALLLDTRTMEIKAAVGSSDFLIQKLKARWMEQKPKGPQGQPSNLLYTGLLWIKASYTQ